LCCCYDSVIPAFLARAVSGVVKHAAKSVKVERDRAAVIREG
jgi:hypothetical protein